MLRIASVEMTVKSCSMRTNPVVTPGLEEHKVTITAL
jgi:hypothetical protein